MLQNFRNHLQGWIVSFIIGLLVLGLGLFGIQNFFLGRDSKVAAVVGDEKIYTGQLNQIYDDVRRQAMLSNVDLTPLQQANLKEQLLESLIKKEVQYQAGIKAKLRVSPQQLSFTLKNIPLFQENGSFSYSKFQQFLYLNGETEERVLADVHQTLIIEQLKQGVVKSGVLFKNAQRDAVDLYNQTRVFNYLILSAPDVSGEVKVSPEQVQSYYDSNLAEFETPEKVKVEYVLVSPDVIQKKLTISDEAARTYYEENKSLFQGKSFAKAEEQVKRALRSERLQEKLTQISDQLSELVYTHPDSLLEAATQLEVPVKTSDFFSRKGIAKEIWGEQPIVQAAFSPEVLEQNQNSELLRTKDGSLLVLRLKERLASSAQPLSQVKEKISAKLKKERIRSKVQKVGADWLAKLKKDTTAQNLKKKIKGAWKSGVAREGESNQIDPVIIKAVFDLTAVFPKGKKSIWGGVQLPSGDYALLELKNIQSGKISEEDRAGFRQKMEEEYGRLDYDFYVKSLMDKAKIKINSIHDAEV